MEAARDFPTGLLPDTSGRQAGVQTGPQVHARDLVCSQLSDYHP